MKANLESAMTTLVQWLSGTRLSGWLTLRPWEIPLLQTIHIVCVAIVMSSIAFINFRIIGVFARHLPIADVSSRFFPWLWWTMPVLLTTGTLLIIAEPARELQNLTFGLKMLLLTGALLLAVFTRAKLTRVDAAAENPAHGQPWRKCIAALSLALWIGIVYAGRMIAYTQTGP
jgi:uncharacterized membrane protein